LTLNGLHGVISQKIVLFNFSRSVYTWWWPSEVETYCNKIYLLFYIYIHEYINKRKYVCGYVRDMSVCMYLCPGVKTSGAAHIHQWGVFPFWSVPRLLPEEEEVRCYFLRLTDWPSVVIHSFIYSFIRWRGPAANLLYWTEAVQVTNNKTNDRPDLSSEGAPDIDKTITVKQ
jgi:hypothetical protein